MDQSPEVMSEPKNIKEIIEDFKEELRKNMNSPWIYQRKGLSNYLGGVPEQTLIKWEQAGIIKRRKIGKQMVYLKSEIDQIPIPSN